MVANAAARARLRPGTSELRDLLSELEWAASCLVGPEDYPAAAARAGREGPFDAGGGRAGLRGLRRPEVRRRAWPTSATCCCSRPAALEEHAAVAEEFRARYRSFVVDEYQDVTPLQQRLLDAWLGGRDDLCVVGDAQQTIYSFTGATPDHLLRFRERYPAATEVRLVRDYRSTPQVVGLANGVIAKATTSHARLELLAQQPPGPEPVFAEHDDEPAEAKAVAARCKALVEAGTPASEIAVLYRVNAQSAAYEAALSDAGVPYLVRGGERFFDRTEVREAILLLRGAGRAADDDAPAGLADLVADVLRAGWAGSATPRRPAPAPPASAGSRWPRCTGWPATSPPPSPSTGLRELVAELEERAVRPARAERRGRHAGVAARRQGPGVGRRLPRRAGRRHAAARARRHPGRGRGGAPAALRRRHPRALAPVAVLGAVPLARRPRLAPPLALPRRAARRLRAPGARGRVGPRRPARALRAGAVPGVRRVAGRRGRPQARPLRRLPVDRSTSSCSRRCASGARPAPRSSSQPAYCVFTDATLTAIAEQRPGDVAALVRIPGIGQAKLDKYGEEVLALVGADITPP